MRRFSIRTLMAVIVVSAIGLAVLRSANELVSLDTITARNS
jgi:hypothetical protein